MALVVFLGVLLPAFVSFSVQLSSFFKFLCLFFHAPPFFCLSLVFLFSFSINSVKDSALVSTLAFLGGHSLSKSSCNSVTDFLVLGQAYRKAVKLICLLLYSPIG